MFYRINIFFCLLLLGCAATTPPLEDEESPKLNLPQYSGEKKIVFVLDFKNNTGVENVSLGEGIASMLSTALLQSNRFRIVSRGEVLDKIMQEQALSLSGAMNNDKEAIRIGQLLGAEYVIAGMVTEFGIRNYSATAGVLIGFAGKKVITARVAIDARMISVNTSEVIAGAAGTGKSSSSTSSAMLMPVSIEVGAEGFDNTTIGMATRKAIYKVVEELCR